MNPDLDDNKQCYDAEQAMFRITALLVLHDNIA